MNKTAIKNFAVWARNKLIADVSYRASLMGVTEGGIADALPQSTDNVQFYDIGMTEPYSITGEEIKQRQGLVEIIKRKAKESDYMTAYSNVMEEVAYTWFNRLIAVRFMEVNDYLPSHIRVLSSESGKIEPDIVTSPFDAELFFANGEDQNVLSLKNDNKLDEVFRILFIKQCNALYPLLPRLFENLSDYTELLLNVSFIDQDGVVYHLVHDIPEEDFNVNRGGQVEIIGWLYQYYIAEPKDDLINAHKKYRKNDIPFVTQLFTSDWIVKYMVENSLGRMWHEGNKDSSIVHEWEYYLESCIDITSIQHGPEEIKFIDPCMGSGHILVYAFDLFMKMYEEAGWSQRDAAQSILERNIYGLDIDNRAAQLAYFSVMMKARQYNRRILTEKVNAHIIGIEESNELNENALLLLSHEGELVAHEIIELFKEAKIYGSLIRCNLETEKLILLRTEIENLVVQNLENIVDMLHANDLKQQLLPLVEQAIILSQKYEIVVTNPPYLSSSLMPDKLKNYINSEYEEFKGDTFAAFTKRVIELCDKGGHIGLLMPYVWMFISAYEKMRRFVNCNTSITSLVQLEYNAFEAACVPVAALTMQNNSANRIGEYIRLSDFRGPENQGPKTLEAVKNPECGYRYHSSQDRFKEIPGEPIAYWVNENFIESFKRGISIDSISDFTGSQHITADNDRFLRCIWEIPSDYIHGGNWYLYAKGGEFRKWYGNLQLAVDWTPKALAFYQTNPSSNLLGEKYRGKEGITYTELTSSVNTFRYLPEGCIFDKKGPSIVNVSHLFYCLALFCTPIAPYYFSVLNPSISTQVKDVKNMPIIIDEDVEEIAEKLSKENVRYCKEDWDSFETSWEFKRHPLV